MLGSRGDTNWRGGEGRGGSAQVQEKGKEEEAPLGLLRRGKGCEMSDCNPKFVYLYGRWLLGLAWASWASFFSQAVLIKDRLG